MGIKDGYEIGMEILKFWSKFKGRRVRIWPSELTIRICSESGKKWVTSADGREPYWWETSREKYAEERRRGAKPDDLVSYAAEYLTDASTPHIESVEQAKLFEATISDIVKQPPGLYLTDIQYWAVVEGAEGNKVAKIDSNDEAVFLPLTQLARIDFVSPRPFSSSDQSSWDFSEE